MTIGERIRARRKELGLTVDELAEKLAKNRATIYRYESNEIEKLPTTVLEPLAVALEVTPGYLMGWEEPDTKKAVSSNATVLPSDKIRMVPIFESVSAGFGAYADDRITGYLPCYILNDQEAANTLCITVQGDSMYPKIENGDIVQVLRQDWAENGQIAVVLLDGETGLVKRYEADKNTIRLISINPEYPPKEFSGIERTRIRVLGVVKKIIKEV